MCTSNHDSVIVTDGDTANSSGEYRRKFPCKYCFTTMADRCFTIMLHFVWVSSARSRVYCSHDDTQDTRGRAKKGVEVCARCTVPGSLLECSSAVTGALYALHTLHEWVDALRCGVPCGVLSGDVCTASTVRCKYGAISTKSRKNNWFLVTGLIEPSRFGHNPVTMQHPDTALHMYQVS